MTQEEKARAYDEALERAKAAMDIAADKDLVGGVVRTIFPEFKECEDERTRKWLLDYAIEMIAGLESDISLSTYDGIKGHDPEAEAELTQWQKARAYLERQKEPIPIPDKFSGLKSLMLQYFDSAVHRNDDAEIESDTDLFGRKILDYVWKYSDEQKEQKPKAKAKSPLSPHELYDAKIEGISQGRQDVLDHPEQFGLQKPAEWSEDSLKFEEGFKAGRESGLRDGQKYVLNNLDSYGLCKPAEWSEEDKEKIVTISEIIEHCTTIPYSGGTLTLNKEYKKELLCFIKSLRPQYHGDVTMTEAYKMGKEAGEASRWKPSEEQMKALQNAVALTACDKELVRLYNQLKKL